jgi:hypothetical protein
MTSAFPPMVNVAHVAGADGKCARCNASIGAFTELQDDGVTYKERPWLPGERVIEYECADSRTRFADWAAGFAVDCQP